MYNILFNNIDWSAVAKEEHKGEQSTSYWQTRLFDGLRIRIVEYLPGYITDHWCRKGHIVHCLEGEFINELENGEQTLMKKGDTYVVSDNLSTHKSHTQHGAKLLIIDGGFLTP